VPLDNYHGGLAIRPKHPRPTQRAASSQDGAAKAALRSRGHQAGETHPMSARSDRSQAKRGHAEGRAAPPDERLEASPRRWSARRRSASLTWISAVRVAQALHCALKRSAGRDRSARPRDNEIALELEVRQLVLQLHLIFRAAACA
jgi:hypothetical protein